jgi:hypothetical protein
MPSLPFFVTRRDPVTGRKIEVAVTDIPAQRHAPTSERDARAAALARLDVAMPRLLHQVERKVVEIQAKLSVASGTAADSLTKELARWRRRAGLLAEGKLPFGPKDAIDTLWTNMSDPLLPDATLLGMLAGDEVMPQPGSKPVAAEPQKVTFDAARRPDRRSPLVLRTLPDLDLAADVAPLAAHAGLARLPGLAAGDRTRPDRQGGGRDPDLAPLAPSLHVVRHRRPGEPDPGEQVPWAVAW